jgi:DNA-binding transcriptional MerR regulator
MATTYSISDLAREFDLTTRAIRFYEDMGLLQPERSGPGGRNRVYSHRDRTRLKLTLRAKRLGLSLNEAKELIDMYDTPRDTGPQLQKFLVVLDAHKRELEAQMAEIEANLDEVKAHEKEARSLLAKQGEKPAKAAEDIYLGWNVETIFSYKDNMFMGTPTGMLIYSVKDPLKPTYASSVQHVFGCDPVVVDNDLAYVTVHSEANRCGQSANELMVVDVSDVSNPKQLVSYTMTSPKGLGIDNGKLFICDDGLKIYKITEPQTLMANKIAQFKDMAGFDVIAYNNIVMMIAEDGIYQYDYSNENLIKYLSKIPIGE